MAVQKCTAPSQVSQTFFIVDFLEAKPSLLVVGLAVFDAPLPIRSTGGSKYEHWSLLSKEFGPYK